MSSPPDHSPPAGEPGGSLVPDLELDAGGLIIHDGRPLHFQLHELARLRRASLDDGG